MKQGLEMKDLAREVYRQAEAKRDFVAPVEQIVVDVLKNVDMDRSGLLMSLQGIDIPPLEVTDCAHRQIGGAFQIPWQYYDRMLKDSPDLLAQNVNYWLQHNPATKKMVRTLDGKARAFLFDRYRTLDNEGLLEAIFPALHRHDMEIKSCDITDTYLYIKVVDPSLEASVGRGKRKKGDILNGGLVISNSEVGHGALAVKPMIYRCVCDNGMITMVNLPKDHKVYKYHSGAKITNGGEEIAREFMSDETKRATDEALFMQAADLVDAACEGKIFKEQMKAIKAAAGEKITGDPEKVVEVTAKQFNLTESERGGVLRHLIDDGDLSRWGMINAITRQSQDVENYDRATELERTGGKLLEMSNAAWSFIAEAKAEAAAA